jgi:aminoglycoside phosphotransferase (APT) family kinase protein
MSDASIPTAADIDAAWLTHVLREAGVARDASVVSVEGTSIGTGQVGENVRFRLAWDRDDPSLPASVVGKFPSASELSRATAVQIGTYQREVGFYRELQALVDIRTPHIHHVAWNADTHDFAVIMEDLSNSSQGDQLAGCSVDQARAAAVELAGLHAPTWGATDEVERDWINRPSSERTEVLSTMYAATLPGFVDRYAEQLGDDIVDIARRIVTAYPTLATAIADWAGTSGAWCVVHADYRLDNLLFGDTPDAPAVVAVDWQTTSIGIGPADVAYLIGSGLLTDDRRAHERDLFAAYLDALRERGVSTDDAAAWDGYVLGTAGGLLMAIIASQIVERTDRGDQMFMAMAARHAIQLDELGLLDVIGA